MEMSQAPLLLRSQAGYGSYVRAGETQGQHKARVKRLLSLRKRSHKYCRGIDEGLLGRTFDNALSMLQGLQGDPLDS